MLGLEFRLHGVAFGVQGGVASPELDFQEISVCTPRSPTRTKGSGSPDVRPVR